MFKEKEDNKITIERERERERVKIRRFKYFLFTAFVISAIFASSPVFVSASGESSPSRSILASIGSFFKGLVFSSGNQADNQNENDSNIITYDKAEFEKQIQSQKQLIEEALNIAKQTESKYSGFQKELNSIKSSGLKIEGPIVERKTMEKTIERILSGVSENQVDSKIANLKTELQNLNISLTNQINSLSASSNRQTSAVYQAVSLTNKIDSLSGTRLTNITVSGVSGLTDSDIPDGITASNYLLLAGGTLSGALTGTSASFSSTLTVSASTTFNGVEYKWPSADGTANQALVSNGAGGLSWTTISGGSGASADWVKQTNYGVLNLTASTTIPYWAKDAFYASSTSVFQGLATFGNASTSQISATNSYLGTVLSGTWNGTAIGDAYLTKSGDWTGTLDGQEGSYYSNASNLINFGSPFYTFFSATNTDALAQGSTNKYWSNTLFDNRLSATTTLPNLTTLLGLTNATTTGITSTNSWLGTVRSGTWNGTAIGNSYIDDDITLTNLTQITNRAISDTTGTLTVARGGTGQTAFSQGWLNSDGTTLSASTSPTVNYLTATSTTATSTFPYLSVTTNSNLGTVVGGTWNGTAIGDSYLTKSGDWTGTLDTYEASSLLARANHTGTQGISTLSNYDWTFSNNYGVVNLTASSTKPIWARGGINASSTSNFVYASTTALTISGNSYLGTVSSGAWNGTAIGNSYIDDDITLTNLTQITNRAISDTTGTLTVARGGTGQTSFGQGWLHSDGTTFTSSTSPTVNYITATSTTATSTFAWGLQANALNITSTSATSTFARGIDLAGGCFAINGTCVGGSSSQWTTNGSNIYYNTGNIGIGTSSPWSLLSLKGSSGAQMTIAQADTNYTQLTVDASGNLTITPSGSTITIPDDNLKVCAGDACQTTALNSGNGNLTVENNIEIGGAYNRTCPTGYVWVPGSAKFGTLPGFCVMKYEAKNDGSNNAVSTATGGPYVSIDQPTSRSKCEAIGLGYHLISEPEWMTIAENIAQTPINDMDDDAGLQLATGHSDNAPASALAATSASDPVVSGCNLSATMENAANAYSASSCEIQGDGSYGGDDTDKGFYGTSQAWATTGYSAGVASKSQLRTHILSNGNVIWDIAGNVWEWTDAYVNGTAEKPTAVTDTWQEWSAITNYLGLSYARPQNPSWASANGIGKYYAGTVAGQRGFFRGGNWADGGIAGVFTLRLDIAPSYADAGIGFRCSR